MKTFARREFLGWSAGLLLPAVTSRVASAARNEGSGLAFSEMYVEGTMEFSEKLLALENKQTTIKGYMAPPLKAEAAFFVLTSVPMAVCPFCGDAVSWPDNIVFVRTREIVAAIDYDRRIGVTGRLELGTDIDKDTGFVSRVRLVDARYARVAGLF